MSVAKPPRRPAGTRIRTADRGIERSWSAPSGGRGVFDPRSHQSNAPFSIIRGGGRRDSIRVHGCAGMSHDVKGVTALAGGHCSRKVREDPRRWHFRRRHPDRPPRRSDPGQDPPHGVDAPEIGQDFGGRARQAASDLAFRKEVTIRPRETDRYGRTVAEVILPDGRSLNREMVRAGLAWWYRRYAPADQDLTKLESEAKSAQRGLWAQAKP